MMSRALTSVPSELLIKIVSALPCFHDVFALAATCTSIHHLWLTNVASIYKRIAPRTIVRERYARKLLADQRESSTIIMPQTVADVVQLLKNAKVVEDSIAQFEREVVWRVRCCNPKKYYGDIKHPPYLTATERPRFARAYYEIWGMMTIDPSGWESRMDTMTLKRLYCICEMTRLTQSIGNEEQRSPHAFPNANPKSWLAVNRSRSPKREQMEKRIWNYIERKSRNIHGEDPDYPWIYAKEDGFMWYVVLWDHWQKTLKTIVCGRSSKEPPFPMQYDWSLWDESTEDETQG